MTRKRPKDARTDGYTEADRAVAKSIERALVRMKTCSRNDARDIGFHMTDWRSDLCRFHEFCLDPKKLKPSEIESLLLDFLIHVPGHVTAATKLMTGDPVGDVFGIGAVGGS